MATINCTNVTAQQALRGQGVRVNLSFAESQSVLPVISVGNTCQISSSGKTGKILSKDSFGRSFLVAPITFPNRFDSTSTPGQLAVNELITVTF